MILIGRRTDKYIQKATQMPKWFWSPQTSPNRRRLGGQPQTNTTFESNSNESYSNPARMNPLRMKPIRMNPTRKIPTRTTPIRTTPIRMDPIRMNPIRVNPSRMNPIRMDPTPPVSPIAQPIVPPASLAPPIAQSVFE